MLHYFWGKKGKGGEKKENKKKHLLQGESEKIGKNGKRMKRKEKQITKTKVKAKLALTKAQ